MVWKGNLILVRFGKNCSLDLSWFSEGDCESYWMGKFFFLVYFIFLKKVWEDVVDVWDGYDFF